MRWLSYLVASGSLRITRHPGPQRWTMSVVVLVDWNHRGEVVSSNSVAKRTARDTEASRRPGDIPAGRDKDGREVVALRYKRSVRVPALTDDLVRQGHLLDFGRPEGVLVKKRVNCLGGKTAKRGTRDQAFENIQELPDITGPRKCHETFEAGIRDRRYGDTEALADAANARTSDSWKVGDMLTQCGHPQLKHVQPVKQVWSEAALLDGETQVSVRSRDYPSRHSERLCAADTFVLTILQNAKELRLQVECEISDLVEEYRSASCQLESARMGVRGPREGPVSFTHLTLPTIINV